MTLIVALPPKPPLLKMPPNPSMEFSLKVEFVMLSVALPPELPLL